jgi:membrane glycosyltransferase
MPDIAARRWIFLTLVLASTTVGVSQLWSVLRIDGLDNPEFLFLILFAILFGWIAASFWMALFGAWAKLSGAILLPLKERQGPSPSRTAILMPVYNEDVARVFSGIEAMHESLALTGATGFDFYVLSDSTDPDHWIAEEVEWQKLHAALDRGDGPPRLFYRHRHCNTGRKSGNIQDFCENWGTHYDYIVVLDADSLMQGETLVRLVRLMDANPRTALIQVPPQLVGRKSLFARIQQFASSVYGPVYSAGLAYLQGPDGNYWGHNAIIRLRAFIAHCGLPSLPGKPPFGGEIMSHDFVEAAFLARAGWDVWMAPDLGGSFEEPPPTIPDFLKRDRRWCQGNLQHLRIVFAQGLKMPSRLHLAMGIMAYVSSPLWLLLLIVSAVKLGTLTDVVPFRFFGRSPSLALAVSHSAELLQLAGATLVLLYGPKLVAMLALLGDRAQRRAHGGGRALLRSVILESIFSTLFAPVVMLAHSWFVFTITLGIATGWGAQQRQDRTLSLFAVARQFWPHTMVGIGASALLYRLAPASFGWFVPLLAGLLLAVPLVAIAGSVALGLASAKDRLFLVPSETQPPPLLTGAHRRAIDRAGLAARDFPRLVLADRAVRALHLQLLRETPPANDIAPERLAALAAAAREGRTGDFTRQDWIALLSDAESLKSAEA